MRRFLAIIAAGALLVALVAHAEPRRLGGFGKQGVPSALAFNIQFCGQGGNAANRYLEPQSAFGEELIPGGATCDAKDWATPAGAEAVPYGLDGLHYWIYGQVCQLSAAADTAVVYAWLNVDQVPRRTFRSTVDPINGTAVGVGRNDFRPIEVLPGGKLSMRVTAGAVDHSADDWFCIAFAYIDPN